MSAQSRTRPRSRRTKAKKVRYNYDSTSDSDDDSSQQQRPSRRSQRIQSYLEDSDNESDSDLESLHSSAPSQQAARRPRYQPPPTRSKSNKRKRAPAPAKPKHNFQLFKRRKPNSSGIPTKKRFSTEIPPSGKIPSWQTLPYQVLQQIMKYASYPLYEKASRTNPSIEWLCGVSTLCRSFHEACIAALLYSPPLYPAFRAHGLLHLLAKDQTRTLINYRSKIKCLDIEVKNLLIRKSGINIVELLGRTPLLERLRLYHNHDDLGTIVWAQPSQAKGRRYAYPDDIFQKLDDMSIKLKSWDWNGRFPTGSVVLDQLANVHTRPSFSEIQELSFLNIVLPDKASDDEINLADSLLISALQLLPQLKSLTFRNCNILTAATLSQLPPSLTSLEINDCQYLTSDLLSIYLSSHGTHLISLTLTGNQSMSLAFLHNLAVLCPHLQHLNLDLTYTDPSSYRDRDPLYDEALPDGPPSWPSSLITISIENLRQIMLSEAEAFLTSIVNAAPDLQSLRKIMVKMIVKDASWRDRAEIRKKWIPKLEDVFLDTSQPEWRVHVMKTPKVIIPALSKEAKKEEQQTAVRKTEVEQTRREKPSGRQSTRIAHLKQLSLTSNPASTSTSHHSDCNDSFSDSNASFAQSPSNSHSDDNTASETPQLISQSDPSRPHNPTQKPSTGNGPNNMQIMKTTNQVKPRMCSTVTLILSDQRPAQDQYHEADFLDSERSGDEEWVGRDLDFD